MINDTPYQHSTLPLCNTVHPVLWPGLLTTKVIMRAWMQWSTLTSFCREGERRLSPKMHDPVSHFSGEAIEDVEHFTQGGTPAGDGWADSLSLRAIWPSNKAERNIRVSNWNGETYRTNHGSHQIWSQSIKSRTLFCYFTPFLHLWRLIELEIQLIV